MRKSLMILTAAAAGLFSTTTALADGGFTERYNECVEKFATPTKSASVTLQCNAASGKLDECKVTDNSTPGAGFDKAAMCVAKFLPIGTKTGVIHVPLKFVGS